MSHQAPHQVTPRATLSPATIEELLADPSRTRGLVLESVPELLTPGCVARRVAQDSRRCAALANAERAHRERKASATPRVNCWARANSPKLFGVPESWVREQARLGILPSFKLGHYVRFRIEEVERFLAQRASQAA